MHQNSNEVARFRSPEDMSGPVAGFVCASTSMVGESSRYNGAVIGEPDAPAGRGECRHNANPARSL